MIIFDSICELIGNTPLFRPNNLVKGLPGDVLLKLEYLNPAGSIKDRAALQMIIDAEERGELRQSSTIIEPTSGNTGIGLAAIAASRGYKTIIVMPDSMSVERQKLMKAYGAELVLTPGADGMSGAIKKAEEIKNSTENAIIAGQFTNPSNPKAHVLTTGPEIWDDTDGKIDVLVAGVGTGGTLTGTAKFLKEKNPEIKVIAVEPTGSPLLSKGVAGSHGLQGIGANFIPEILDQNLIDEIITVSEEEAYSAGRALACREGILVGITSGAALHAALTLAKSPKYDGKTIVAILPDTGDRYLSTPMYE